MKTTRLNKTVFLSLLAAVLLLCGALCLAMTASAEGASNLTDSITDITLKDTDGDGSYEINSADDLFAFANLVNAGNTSIDAELTADIDLNPGYTFTFVPDTGLTEVTHESKGLIAYLGTGIKGDGSNSNYTFDATASVKGAIYANADDAIADAVDASFDGIRKWTPIGNAGFSYQGNFNGGKHLISGLYFNEQADAVGLFGNNTGTIQKVGLSNFFVCAKNKVGTIVGNGNNGTIQDCYTTESGLLIGVDQVGGIVGYSFNREQILNCHNSAMIMGNNDVGGIIGQIEGYNEFGQVLNCHNTATVMGNCRVGGIVGYIKTCVQVLNCHNTATVMGNICVGGICGNIDYQSTVESSYNEGTILGNQTIGGICGAVNDLTEIRKCYNNGAVQGGLIVNSDVGGLIGYMFGDAKIQDSYNTGCVRGGTSVGGLVGCFYAWGLSKNCYNVGSVTSITVDLTPDPYRPGGVCGAIIGTGNGDLLFSYPYSLEDCVTIEGQGYLTITEEEAQCVSSVDEFASGTVTQTFNGTPSSNIWWQVIGRDAYPVLHLKHDYINENGSMFCIHCEAVAVARVTETNGNTTEYTSLAQALSVAERKSASVLTLLEHITIENDHQIDVGTFTFDLNGKNITSLNSAALRFVGGTVTMVDDSSALGKVSAQIVVDGGDDDTLIIEDGEFMDVLVNNNGSLTVTGGDFFDLDHVGGTLTITGGDFVDLDHVGGTLTITGGSFDKISVGELGSFTDVSSDGFNFYQSNKLVDFTNLQQPYILTNVTVRNEKNAVAKVGDTLFEDFKSAMEYANKINGGATVILLKDITLDKTITVSNDIILRGRHTITRGTSGTLFKVSGNATFTLDGGIVIDGNNNWIFDKEGFFDDLKANLADPIKGEDGTTKPGHAHEIYGYSCSAKDGLVSSSSMFSVSAGGNIIMNQVTIQNVWGDNNNLSTKGNKASSLFGTFPAGSELIMNDGCLIQHVRGSIVHGLYGVWTINGGKITDLHDQNDNGALTSIQNGGMFIINGGEICNVTLYGANVNGSGILAELYGTNTKLIINGGHFYDNAAFADALEGGIAYGAAIYLNGGGIFEMNGGLIERTICNSWTAITDNGYVGKVILNAGRIVSDESVARAYGSRLVGEVIVGENMILSGHSIAVLPNKEGVCHLIINGTVDCDILVPADKVTSPFKISFGKKGVLNGNVSLEIDMNIDAGTWNGEIIVDKGATLTVTGGEFENIRIKEGATLNITGGSIQSLTVEKGGNLIDCTESDYFFYQFGKVLNVSHLYHADKTYTVTDVSVLFGADLSDAEIKLEKEEYIYDSSVEAYTPALTVKIGGRLLKLDEDYTVAYSNNTTAGIATVTITAKGNVYTGTRVITFKIIEKSATVEEIENILQEITNIEEQIQTGETSTNEIIQQIENVIEKIETIENNTAVSEDVNKAIDDAKNAVTDSYEKALEEAVKKLEVADQENAENLHSAMEDLKTLIDAAEDYADTQDTALKTELTEKISEASESLLVLIKKVQENLDDAKEALDKAIADGDKALDEKITNLNEALEDAKAAAEASDEALKTELTEKIEKADDELSEAIQTVQKNLDDAKEALDKAIADGDKALDEKITNLNEALEDAKAAAEASDESLKTELTEKIEKADDALAEAIKKVQENLDNAKEELDKAIADGDNALDEKITNLNKALEDAKAAAEASDEALKTELTEKIEKADDALSEAIQTVQKNLDDAKEALDKAIADGDKALDEKITNLGEAIEEAERVAAAADEQVRTELITRIEESNRVLTESIQIVQEKLDYTKITLEKAILDGDAKLEEKITDLDEAIKAAKAAATAADEELRQELTKKIENAVDTLANAVGKMQQDLDDALALFKEKEERFDNMFTIAVIFATIAVLGNFVLMAWGIVGKSKK